jgi:hypothetical protein
MAVKVKNGQVNDGKKNYIKDDIITGLKKEDEARLVSLGVAEYLVEEKAKKPTQNTKKPDEDKAPENDAKAPEEKGEINIQFNPDDLIKDGEKK